MKLSKEKELIENGTHYIDNDIEKEFSEELIRLSDSKYNQKKHRNVLFTSEITDDEEIVYQMQVYSEWIDCASPIRIKPKPDFSKELEALNKKANENNMKVIVTFENNL